jgi:serine/threonine protein kinase/ABC-type branched-subunit amino acid transport system substrate-binding protein
MTIQPGDLVGQYEILEELGRGGMATVFRARQSSMGRDVAVKILPEQFLHDANFLARFNNEARVIAGLEHRSILPVYDYGEAGGTPYIVMRLMPHGSLRARLRHGPLPLADAARLVGQVAEALDYAHARGVIHRDMKPDNILLDDEGNAYLSDFGIAKVMEATAQSSGSMVVGTPSYMAPEQARGGRPSRQTDIYSLGAMSYEMLTGQPPFLAEDFIALLFKHASEPVPRLHDLNPAAPEALQAVIERAMAKEPAARYATAHEMAAEFQAQAGGAPPAATRMAPPRTEGGQTVYESVPPAPSWRPATPPPGDQTVAEPSLPLPPIVTPPPSAAPARPARWPRLALWGGLGVGGCLVALVAVWAAVTFGGGLGGLFPVTATRPAATRTQAPPTPTRLQRPTPTPAPAQPTPLPPVGGGGLIRVVSIGPLTGGLAPLGVSIANAALLAFEQKRQRLVEAGFEVEYQVLDDEANVDVGVHAAEQVLADAPALCVVGHLNSGVSVPASELYAQGNLAMLSPGSTRPVLTARGLPNVFRLIGRDDLEALLAAQFARDELGAASAFIVFEDTDPGRQSAEAFVIATEATGLELLGQRVVASEADGQAVLAELQALAQEHGAFPDVVFFGGSAAPAGRLFRLLREGGVPSVFMGTSALDSVELAEAGGEFLLAERGTFVATGYANAPHYPGGPRFAGEYADRFGEPPLNLAPFAYDAMSVCLDAIERAARAVGRLPARDEVTQAVRETKYEGVTGPITFNPHGDREEAPYYVIRVASADPGAWSENPVLGPIFLAQP